MATRTSAERAPSAPRAGWRAPPLLSPITIGIVLVLMLTAAYLIGSWVNDRNAARAIAVFAIGVVSFLGILGLSHRDIAGSTYDSAQVRVAVTTAFMMVYFAALGIFLFSTNEVGEFGRGLMDNLTSLFGVIMGFYFAASAVEAYSKAKQATARAQTEATAAAAAQVLEAEATQPRDTASLEQELRDSSRTNASLVRSKRFHSPSSATSTTESGLIAVRGSMNASTPRCDSMNATMPSRFSAGPWIRFSFREAWSVRRSQSYGFGRPRSRPGRAGRGMRRTGRRGPERIRERSTARKASARRIAATYIPSRTMARRAYPARVPQSSSPPRSQNGSRRDRLGGRRSPRR
jgi:hypothetical protein